MNNNINVKPEDQDPVVVLLKRALEYMTGKTERRIDNIEKEIVSDILAQSLPDCLSLPVPLMAMLQVQKRNARKDDTTPTDNIQGTYFKMKSADPKNNRDYNFMPLLNATIFKGSISEVKKGTLQNSWKITLDAGEWVDNLSGLSLYINNEDISIENIELYSGENKLPIAMMSDYNHLPFTDVLCHYMQYNGNAEMYKLLMHWHDILYQKAHAYCIVRPYDSHEIQLHRNGSEIPLTMILKGKGNIGDLNAGDIYINCIPIINVEEGSKLISDIQRLDLCNGKYLLVDATSDDPSLKKRKYGTTHDGVVSNKEVYLLLKKDEKQYHHIHYLATDDVEAGFITCGFKMKSSSSVFISSVVVDVFPNKEVSQESFRQMGKYHLQTNDRIVTPTDILTFCKTQLINIYGYDEGQIKSMKWDPVGMKAMIGLEGVTEIPEAQLTRQSIALESMIAKRTAHQTSITINIKYNRSGQ